MPLGHHIRLRPRDDEVIAKDPVQRRLVARVVLRHGKDFELLAFGLADNHLQLHSACTDGDAAHELGRRIAITLALSLDRQTGFERGHVKPINNGGHMYNTFRYDLGQAEHHRIEHVDPLREGTNLPDLLGLRTIGRYTARNVRRCLPRIRREDLLAFWGWTDLAEASRPLEWLSEAGCAAAALPGLTGYGREVSAVRRAMLEVAGRGVRTSSLASLLGISRRSIERLRHQPVDALLAGAIRRQLGAMTRLSPLRLGATEPDQRPIPI